MKQMKYDFSGYATKFNVLCSDGRIIKDEAFKHQDGKIVSMIYSHGHGSLDNIIGHGLLEYREGDGMYFYGSFNDTDNGKIAKEAVAHGDLKSLSIFANRLKHSAGKQVVGGEIKEVSLVVAGANDEAYIDYVAIAHGDDYEISETEAVFYLTDEEAELSHSEGEVQIEGLKHADTTDKTISEVFNSLSDEQRNAVYAIVGALTEGSEMQQNDQDDDNLDNTDQDDDALQHSDNGGGKQQMKTNVFDGASDEIRGSVLSHSDVKSILDNAKKLGNLRTAVEDFLAHQDDDTMMQSYLAHADTYGVKDISILFPDAQKVQSMPEWEKRRTEWVNVFLGGIKKVPFSKFKTMHADITEDEARAKGYIKGNEKIEEVFKLFQRVTDATTVYKKQKLDKNDIVDITDFDVVMWLKAEMRLMLDEEIARAMLIGDGRAITDRDKISEDHIRPIYKDADLYSMKYQVASDKTGLDELEAIMDAMDDYKGTGSPVMFTTRKKITEWKKLKDGNLNYRFKTKQEIADFIGVSQIIDVEVMQGVNRDIEAKTYDLVCIIVSLRDYTSGANKGGQIASYNQFDIDFNQEKYLIETRVSGGLTKLHSAIVIEKEQAAG